MAYVDFHVHIDYYKDFLDKFREYEMRKIYALFVTNLPEIYESCSMNFPKSKYVKIALGYNPMFVGEYDFNKPKFDKYFEEVDYIGEVGLDYSKKYVKYKNKQWKIFNYISQKVGSTRKIMSVHSRGAVAEVLDVLRTHSVKKAVFHWYTGPVDNINDIVEKGYYFSINPSMLSSEKGRKIIKAIPIDRILFETDGPFGKLKREDLVPSKIANAYVELGKFLEIDDIRSIIMKNFKELLLKE